MAMMLESEDGILSAADARVFTILMTPNRTMRRLMAADRTMAGAWARVATLRRMKQAADARAYARAERERVQEEANHSIAPGWGRLFHVHMPETKPTLRKTTPTRAVLSTTTSRRALRAYKAPLVDGRGRVALYLKIGYVGFRSKNWRPGLPAAHIDYIYRDEALEAADLQLGAPISNMGESVEEIIAGWRMLETIEEGYRANAKVQYRLVWNLPHDLTPDQRREMVEAFCERTFGRLGLPYAAAIHEPDAKSDQRNYHAHICFSTRPCERTGDHRWAVSEEKVNGLTDPAGLRLVRALAAAHMNRAAQAANLTVRFTHQTYAQRGLNAVRQEHVGPAAMAAHDRGETVNAVLRNAQVVEGNEAAEDCRQAEHGLVLAEREEALLEQAVTLARRRREIGAQLVKADSIHAVARRVLRAPRRTIVQDRNAAILAVIALRRGAADLAARIDAVARRGRVTVMPAILVRQVATALRTRIAGYTPRRGVDAALAATHVIGGHAATIAGRLRVARKPPHPTPSRMLARQAMRLQARITAFSPPSIPATAKAVALPPLLATMQRLSDQRERADRLRADTAAWAQRITAHQQAVRDNAEVAARALFLTAEKPPYQIDGTRVVLDLTTFDADAVALFRSLDADARTALLKERFERDRAEAKTARERAEALARDKTAAQARRALIADACQLVMQTDKRPYRIIDRKIVMDWSGLGDADRATLDAVGGRDPDLRRAMLARAQRDYAADVAARDGTAAPPGATATVQTPQPVPQPQPAQTDVPVDSAWQRARHLRAAAMADVLRDRTDPSAVHAPGAQPARPGVERSDRPEAPSRRWHPGITNGGPER
ncbi:MobA/MobL family protein [Sphingomonas sp. CL5.1]|uniref:MobA/MobL family protein n=1 Tax=Sphingomonas sp. CL5.1 TaxID=2653203 RepID=UPI0015829DCF|nr:MobA/MobL family protein [Sphingomonas sp. CL5.1]QKS00134.1 MobA/MobL family protein [Sphingomonas sp. CL5.1]